LAQSQVTRALILFEKSIDDCKYREYGEVVLQTFATPLHLYREIVKRIIETGCDLTKKSRRNWIWDFQIAFVPGANHIVGGQAVRLITGDQDIVAAAVKAGCGDSVSSLEEYLAVFVT